ncbi:MAG: hypothetical protein VYC39_17240 [Myxococcota bacterium]|nr:hypothetical protein [Myxococcota bacterium]
MKLDRIKAGLAQIKMSHITSIDRLRSMRTRTGCKSVLACIVFIGVVGCEANNIEGQLYVDNGSRPPIVLERPDSGVSTPMNPDAGTPPVEPPGPTECNIERVFQTSGCANSGCHAPPVQAALDLVAPNLAQRLMDAPSHVPGCENRKVIDSEDYTRSVLLQSVGAPEAQADSGDSCQIVMPPAPWTQMSDADITCLSEWVKDAIEAHKPPEPPPEPFEAASVYAVARKVKNLVNGQAPTQQEIDQLAAGDIDLKQLIEQWATGDAYSRKLSDFLLVALQQRFQVENNDQFDRLRRGTYGAEYQKILEESFVRTAADIIERGAPFNEILTTKRWHVTTANLVLLRYADQTATQRNQRHLLFQNAEDAPASLREQIAQRRWHLPSLPSNCDISQQGALDMLFGFVLRRQCSPQPNRNVRFTDGPLTPADFEDWRVVEFVDSDSNPSKELIPFYDVRNLRNAQTVATRVPRVGFFTTNVFLNNWATNIDNQFRVTTNQALLGALHLSYSSSEPTEPLLEEGLDPEHSMPGSSCHGCHRQLDTMRVYFAKHYNVSYQLQTGARGDGPIFDPMPRSSFAFRGVTRTDGDLYDFAETLSSHPRFATAWVQKLCLYANSARCDEQDPAFQQIVQNFSSHLDFKRMMIDLYASPIVTGSEETKTWGKETPMVSILRREQLCALLDQRTGRNNVCGLSRVSDVLGLIPRDDFARGAVDPSQPTQSSAFFFAAAEAVCEAVARSVVTQNAAVFPFSQPEASTERLVSQLMALPSGHPRYAATLAALSAHYQALIDAGRNERDSLRSTFTLACLSPDVMGVGL